MSLYAIAGLNDFETLLVSGIVTVVGGVAALLTWIVKGVLPRILDSIVAQATRTADAVAKIPEAIKSFELAMISSERRITDRIEAAKDIILEDIRDRRISALEKAVTSTGQHAAVTVEHPPSK